jgi:hypothetical protein
VSEVMTGLGLGLPESRVAHCILLTGRHALSGVFEVVMVSVMQDGDMSSCEMSGHGLIGTIADNE